MITFDDALEIAFERKEQIDSYMEYDNAYVFSFSGDSDYVGGWGHTPVVVMKEDGKITTMPEFVASGAGKVIKDLTTIEFDEWYKNEEDDQIWWLDNEDEVKGEYIFSFDKQTRFNLFADYPHNLTNKQKEIFDNENPYWAKFFKNRK